LNRNVRLLIFVSWLFGYASGAYEVLFPLYLDWVGVSFTDIGIIFSITAATMAGLNVVIGSQSDVRGRKVFYTISLAMCSAINFVVPLLRKLWETLILSITQSASSAIRGSVHNVMLFEHARKAYLTAYSRVNGMEYFSQAIGLLGAGLILAASSFQSAFWVSASVLACALCIFAFGFKEERAERVPEDVARKGGGAYLPRELKIFAISGLVMAIGSGLSHGFFTPLFFIKKFGADQATVSIILTIHRLSFGVPMIFADKVLAYLRRFRQKAILIVLMIYQGASISICAFLPDIVSATIVFASHDLLAASFFIPILSVLIQSHCRDSCRGADSNKVASMSSIGSIGAPFLTGILASMSVSYPFLLSGILYASAALILLPI